MVNETDVETDLLTILTVPRLYNENPLEKIAVLAREQIEKTVDEEGERKKMKSRCIRHYDSHLHHVYFLQVHVCATKSYISAIHLNDVKYSFVCKAVSKI